MGASDALLLAIDPGPRQSAYVELGVDLLPVRHGILANEELRFGMFYSPAQRCVIEQVESYGMRVGQDVFETVFWSGRLAERWAGLDGASFERLPRTTIKLHLCSSRRARDSDIRQALIDRYGGSRSEAIGTKKIPGPLHGVRKDIWQALALGVTWWETRDDESDLEALK